MKAFIILAAFVAVASAAYNQNPFGRQPSYNAYKPKPTQAPYRPVAPVQHHSPGAEVPILRQAYDQSPDGSYSYSYETGNGIAASENGVGGVVANGDFRFTSPEGIPFQVTYVADENGFQPAGDHLPTPPPVPAAILRALDYIAAHPYHEEQHQYKANPTQRPVQPSYNQYKKPTYGGNKYNRF